MSTIYHIARKADWEAARAGGTYASDSLATEGFIHCSTAEQIIATANRIFKGHRDLLLLAIECARVGPEIRYENLEGGTEQYPHIYGALDIAAVTAAHEFPPDPDGRFTMPAALDSTNR